MDTGTDMAGLAKLPDLLVTDMLMPGKDGVETIMAFRREHPSVNIVAMSGGGRLMGKEPLGYARLIGASATLEKPFEFRALSDTIRTLLEPEAGTTRSPGGADH